jgi:hypothetical protein
MDSLPTGSMQSWLIVAAAAALSPIAVLFLADAIDQLFRQAKGRSEQPQQGQKRDRSMGRLQNWAVGSVIAALILLSPVVAFVMVIAGELLIDMAIEAGHP